MALRPPAGALCISTLDMHTGGEPLRSSRTDCPIEGRTVLEKRRYFREHYDHLRTGLMFEPRGHADMYGAVISPLRTLTSTSSSCTTKATARCAATRSSRSPSS